MKSSKEYRSFTSFAWMFLFLRLHICSTWSSWRKSPCTDSMIWLRASSEALTPSSCNMWDILGFICTTVGLLNRWVSQSFEFLSKSITFWMVGSNSIGRGIGSWEKRHHCRYRWWVLGSSWWEQLTLRHRLCRQKTCHPLRPSPIQSYCLGSKGWAFE